MLDEDYRKKLARYESEITACDPKKSESVFQRIADSFEDDLLEFEGFPDEYFTFVLRLLSDSQIYSKPGVWNFLLALSTEKHRMQDIHYRELAASFVANYEKYLNEDLCLAVCDFVARNYPSAKAGPIFAQLKTIEDRKAEGLRGFVNDGLRILAAEDQRNETVARSKRRPS